MNTLHLTWFHKKILPYSFALLFVLCVIGGTKAQSVIFKQDGSQITVHQLSKTKNTISFLLQSDSIRVRKYLGISAIDSIHYVDGTVEYFTSAIRADKKEYDYEFKLKNLVGVNMWPLFYSKINVYYERLFFDNQIGVRNYFMIDVGSKSSSYGTINRTALFYYSAGISYYFLQSYFSRLGVGASFLYGSFDTSYWLYSDPYSVSETARKSGLLLNTSYSYKVYNQLYASMVVQVPVGFKEFDEFLTIQIEISFHF